MGPSHNLWLYACKTAWLAPELQVSMGLSPLLLFLHSKQRLWTRITSLYGSQTSPVLLYIQNSVIWNKMTSSHGFQPSSVVLCMKNSDFRTRTTSLCRWIDPTCGFCMQNSDFWTRITSLHGSQTSPVILCMQYSVISTRITCLYGSQPSSVVFACKTAWLSSESLVSMGPSLHVWLLDAKQRLFDLNNKSVWVPNITCRFVPGKQHL